MHGDVREQRAAGIGIDLDELGSARRDVEVEALEDARGAWVAIGDDRRVLQYARAISRQRYDFLHRLDEPVHLAYVVGLE